MRGTRGGTPTKPKHTEESIQRALCENHPILTKPVFEMVGFIFYAWESDYLAISKAGYVYECEIKISHSDFLNEAAHKQEKMRLLGGEDMTVAKYHSYDKYGIECGKDSKNVCVFSNRTERSSSNGMSSRYPPRGSSRSSDKSPYSGIRPAKAAKRYGCVS